MCAYSRRLVGRWVGLPVICGLLTFALAAPTGAQAMSAHGQLLKLVRPSVGEVSQSSNWFGYGQGAAQKGVKLFHAITGEWTVPKVSQHRKGQAEYSSDWIGIGGGCVNSGCTVGDNTLIQTGTEQDVSAKGKPSYQAWWELIPQPATPIKNLKVSAGDRMSASITEVATQTWKITITDLNTKKSYTTTTAYTSSEDTAEWIEETPLILGANAGFAPLPNLTSPHFIKATTNGQPAKLTPSEEIELTNSSGKVIGTPSAPDPTKDGFNACAWARICAAPTTG